MNAGCRSLHLSYESRGKWTQTRGHTSLKACTAKKLWPLTFIGGKAENRDEGIEFWINEH